MKKTLVYTLMMILVLSIVSAHGDEGDGHHSMMNGGYGMMGNTSSGFGHGLVCLVFFILAAFLFSVIFWGTYKLMIEEKRRKKK